jgi:hypothetical protein
LQRLKDITPVLGNAIERYYGDIDEDTLHFVVLMDQGKDYLLACTSPKTGFVTPPDLDKKNATVNGTNKVSFIGNRYQNMPVIRRRYGTGHYFNDICLFEDRDKGFMNYMFRLMDENSNGSDMKELRDYIKHFETNSAISRDYELHLKPILTEENTPLVINGLHISEDCSINITKWFNDVLIRVPFRISSDNYYTMKYTSEDSNQDYDYLLPLSDDALEVIDDDIKCECNVSRTKVEVSLIYKGKKVETKRYISTSIDPVVALGLGQGVVIDLKTIQLDLNLAIFPNILSPKSEENDYFKVMLVAADTATPYPTSKIEQVGLSFYKRKTDTNKYILIQTKEQNPEEKSFYGVRPVVIRSIQSRDGHIPAGSAFYEIFNTTFDLVKLQINLQDTIVNGILLPKWHQASHTAVSYTYAIDLGTTNTYISCCNNAQNNEPEQLRMDAPMVSFLHGFTPSEQDSKVSLIEKALAPSCRKNFKTEFAPALIDGMIYRFPIRTALCVPAGYTRNFSLFDNCNIAFFYEKSTGLENQHILTDIKWDSAHEKELRLFIRELLLIAKSAILQKNGQLNQSKLIWFSPLSFSGSTASSYKTLWSEEGYRILHIPHEAIRCVSESEAPYYYFNKKDKFKSVDSVAMVDIGGGSCDFIYFSDGQPQIANSVHFGCDVLWGNGGNEFDNTRENGIYKRAEKEIHFTNPELSKLDEKMRAGTTTTKDIINFWISNNKQCDIFSILRKTYKPLFLYHFTALVYYMAKMYYAKDLACPKSILFCGNGSHYIDNLLADKDAIVEIVTSIFRFVYGTQIDSIQIILPEERKECTCYGGLYRSDSAQKPSVFNFQGDGNKTYETVSALKDAYPQLRNNILLSLNDFSKLYLTLLSYLVNIKEVENASVIEQIKDSVTQGLSDSLSKNFSKQVASLNEHESYNDSIFFLPIVDKLFELTNLL